MSSQWSNRVPLVEWMEAAEASREIESGNHIS